MKRKVDIDREVAADTGIAYRKVARATASFLEYIREHLTDGELVHLDGFGKLHVQKMTGRVRQPISNLTIPKGTRAGEPVAVPVQHKVHFAKAHPFKLQLQQRWDQENVMEKYGVDEQVDQKGLEKAAAEGCPECGSKLEKHGSVLICPNHGSAPFEQGKDGDKQG